MLPLLLPMLPPVTGIRQRAPRTSQVVAWRVRDRTSPFYNHPRH